MCIHLDTDGQAFLAFSGQLFGGVFSPGMGDWGHLNSGQMVKGFAALGGEN
jgi:hypothetical protein